MRQSCILMMLAGLLAAGCASKTETGYEPRKLGDTVTVQRGYYAPAFSPEARQAEAERFQVNKERRPTLFGQ